MALKPLYYNSNSAIAILKIKPFYVDHKGLKVILKEVTH